MTARSNGKGMFCSEKLFDYLPKWHFVFSPAWVRVSFISALDFCFLDIVIFHDCFNLQFPYDMWCSRYFNMLFFLSVYLFSKVPVQIFHPFLNWAVYFLNCWILKIVAYSSLSGMSFANMFSQHIACLLDSLQYHSQSRSFEFWWSLVLHQFFPHGLHLWCWI